MAKKKASPKRRASGTLATIDPICGSAEWSQVLLKALDCILVLSHLADEKTRRRIGPEKVNQHTRRELESFETLCDRIETSDLSDEIVRSWRAAARSAHTDRSAGAESAHCSCCKHVVRWQHLLWEADGPTGWGVGKAAAIARGFDDAQVRSIRAAVEHERDVMGSTSDAKTKHHRSHERGEAVAKLIGALTLHHRYADGDFLNTEPVGNNQLARLARVDQWTASKFFKKQFGGHLGYKRTCADAAQLAKKLKLLNQEFSPRQLRRRLHHS
jgi:hypothetical protein